MKNLIKRLLAFTVCAAMLLSFAGCGKDEEAIDAGEGLGTSKLADGESIENENYILKWVAEENCPVLISKATGAQWSTTPAEILNQTNDEKVVRARNYLESPFIVEYYDSVLGEPDSVRAYTDCIRDANFSATKDGSEMVVEYYFEDEEAFLSAYENHTGKLLAKGVTSVKEVAFDQGYGYLEALEKYRMVKDIPVRTAVADAA